MEFTTPVKSFKVGIIIGSQRVVRVCPQVAQFVLDTLEEYHKNTDTSNPHIEFTLLDIADFDLPLADITRVPSHLNEADLPQSYACDGAGAWSAAVSSCDAFVFVVPQYNWGMPAALKNALDHIFHEWTGKPAMVVAYGGHAGTLSAAQLITVLSGMFLRVSKRPVCMKFPDKAIMFRAFRGENLGLDAASGEGIWNDYREELIDRWNEVLDLLSKPRTKPTIRSEGLQQLWEATLQDAYQIEMKHAAK